jgi:hypothetical protein
VALIVAYRAIRWALSLQVHAFTCLVGIIITDETDEKKQVFRRYSVYIGPFQLQWVRQVTP